MPAPLAYYPFDGDGDVLEDVAGEFDGTLIGGTVVSGRVGMARSFDGAAEYAEIAGLPHLSSLTVSIWVQLSSAPAADVAVFDRWPWETHERSFYLGVTDAAIEPRLMAQGSISGTGAGNPRVTDSVELADLIGDSWVHLAATWSGRRLVLYRDGAPVSAMDAVGRLFDASSHTTLIARSRHAAPVYLSVSVDELAIWDQALSGAHVAELYERGSEHQPVVDSR